MLSKSSSETEQGINVVLGMGVAWLAVWLTISKMQEAIEQVIPLEEFTGQQIMGVSGIAVLFALLAKYHHNHRYPR